MKFDIDRNKLPTVICTGIMIMSEANHPMTRCLHGRLDVGGALPSVTPVYQSSAFEAGSPFFYTRKSNPNVAELEEVVSGLEGAKHGIAVATGMAALRVCLDQLRPGETMVINRLIYGCTFKLVQRVCDRMGINLHILDLSSPQDVERIHPKTSLLLFETPTNPFLKSVDISEISARVKSNNPRALVVVDNTWATPLFQHPLELGADVSVHSATKYMSGHSDVMGGMILTDNDELADAFRAERFYSGAVLDPYAAWLLRRSMQTIGVRLERQAKTTVEMVEFLSRQPQIRKVYYPEVDGRQLRGYGGIIFVELRPELAGRYADLAARLSYFGTGTGMACVTSMIAQPYTGSHASMNDAEKEQMGLSRNLIRLCFGLEDQGDLRRDLQKALASLDVETTPIAAPAA